MSKRHLPIYQHRPKRHHSSFKGRIFVLMSFSFLVFVIIVVRLFQLQIIRHEEYRAIADSQHFGATELPAKRGEIWVQDRGSGEFTKLATNTTLDLVYVDPLIAEEKEKIATSLAPLLFTQEEYANCVKEPKKCPHAIEKEDSAEFIAQDPLWNLNIPLDEDSSLENIFNLEEEQEEEVIQEAINPKSYEQMIEEISQSFLEEISQEEVDFVVLKRDVEEEVMNEIVNEKLPGIFVNDNNFIVYGDPTKIPEGQVNSVARELSKIIDEPAELLGKQLSRRKVRYVFLKNRISPETSTQIEALDLKGVVLIPEHWRFYPEGSLAAHVIGFINRENEGQYGIEAYFENDLQGQTGTIYTKSDPFGGKITGDDSEIVDAIDGSTIVLTIDRIIQQEVEEVLAAAVEEYRADSGQIIIMKPHTGAIVAMANYPTFDPNVFGDSYTLRQARVGEEFHHTVPLFKRDGKGRYMPYIKPKDENQGVENQPISIEREDGDVYIYENLYGPGVFKNRIISDSYEPGSSFKPLIMAAALDAKEVRPDTTFNDSGPIITDEIPPRTIRNSDHEYRGPHTSMIDTLNESLNTGMVFVSRQLGKKLMHKYLEDFGFGQYTNIKLEGETNREMLYYSKWIESTQYNIAFGQSIAVTPIQMISAWAALANGGKLVQPYVVDKIIREDEIIETEPQVIGRALSQEASQLISSMLVSVVNNGHGEPAAVEGYMIAGKTGTAQIAGRGGWEEGEGSTITSFAGYFPALDPEFVMLVKFDRPRIGVDNTWGSTTAAPTFGKIAEFLIEYYNIEPN